MVQFLYGQVKGVLPSTGADLLNVRNEDGETGLLRFLDVFLFSLKTFASTGHRWLETQKQFNVCWILDQMCLLLTRISLLV